MANGFKALDFEASQWKFPGDVSVRVGGVCPYNYKAQLVVRNIEISPPEVELMYTLREEPGAPPDPEERREGREFYATIRFHADKRVDVVYVYERGNPRAVQVERADDD